MISNEIHKTLREEIYSTKTYLKNLYKDLTGQEVNVSIEIYKK